MCPLKEIVHLLQNDFATVLLAFKTIESKMPPLQPRLGGMRTILLGWRDFIVRVEVGLLGPGPLDTIIITNGCR